MRKLIWTPVAALLLITGLMGSASAQTQTTLPDLPFTTITGPVKEEAKSLAAVGGSFPAPLYKEWFKAYGTKIGVTVKYDPAGSGAGITAITKNTADFAASDAALSDAQLGGTNADVLHVPTAFGGIVVTYNVPGTQTALRLTGDLIAGIFQGRIRRWNDPELLAENPQLAAVNQQIILVHRAETSGTTFGFTSYLSSVSSSWKFNGDLGAGTMVSWPRGVSAPGNDGVANTVQANPYAIGYVELNFAIKNQLKYASVKNKAGVYVEPTLKSVSAAVANSTVNGNDLRINAINAPGAESYPIVTATYLLIHKNMQDRSKAIAIGRLAWWMTHEAQVLNEPMLYAKLPQSVALKTEQVLRQIMGNGSPVFLDK